MTNDQRPRPMNRTLKPGLRSAKETNNASTASQPSLFIGTAGYSESMTQITNSLNTGEVIDWRVWHIHRWDVERQTIVASSSNLSSTTLCFRSSGVSTVPNGHNGTSTWIQEFDSPSSSTNRSQYDIDVTVWPHAARRTCGRSHQDNSNERKLSPPGNAARPSESSLESALTKASLPRSGGDWVIVRVGCPGCGTI